VTSPLELLTDESDADLLEEDLDDLSEEFNTEIPSSGAAPPPATRNLGQAGAQLMVNAITRISRPVVQSSPPSWVPGLYWIDTSASNTVMDSNGSAWVAASTMGTYLTLLTADPQALPAVSISELDEVTTAGYARTSVTFSEATAGNPSAFANTTSATFGPFTADMDEPANWSALVTCLSGNSGLFLYSWPISLAQVQTSQGILVPAGVLAGAQGSPASQ
jgi:hypothetical protein